MDYVLPAFAGFVVLASVLLVPKAQSEGTFFRGMTLAGQPPGVWTLTFSQVTPGSLPARFSAARGRARMFCRR